MRACHDHARRLLREKGWQVKQVFRVSSAGDTDSGYEEIDFLNGMGHPCTATVHPDVERKRVTIDVVKWERHHGE
jgi:hypothetical protein